MENIDPRIIAGGIGAIAALLASFLSQLLVFFIQEKQRKKEKLISAYQFALLFLEKLKIEGCSSISQEDYYNLVVNIAILPSFWRRRIIESYKESLNHENRQLVIQKISDIQESISKKII